jgi:lipopolysaccharide/colanic/teichoic acid biosynthesis glycosyltransferase
MVWWRMGSPVLFRQARAGRHGQIFELVKFRTMREIADEFGKPLPDAERLTPFGRWLRATSLDELPEIVNIFRGEMSFVGPRPLHTRYVDRYSPQQRRRLDVTPGLTGLAQVSGRNALGWDERFQLDLAYVNGASLRLDLSILLRTLVTVVSKQGINAGEGETMPEFLGSGSQESM